MAQRSHPSVQPPDVEELLQTGECVALAVDQVPFEVESRGVKNTFCLLVPLVTESGAILQRDLFPNRERVWWMLRSDIPPEEIRVGTVWSAPIERSREYGSPEPEKDHYQVRRTDIKFGSRTFVEVLNLKVAHPDLNELLDPAGIPWPHPPVQRVVVRGGLSVVGPFRAQYDYERGRVQLKATTAGSPCIYRLSRGDFEAEATLSDFAYTANRWDSKSQERRIEITLMSESDLVIFERDGDRHDAASEAQVVKWALDLMEIPGRDAQVFKEVLSRAGDLKGKEEETRRFPGRLERFLALSESRQRVVGLGRKVAEIVAQKEGFRELVDLHVDQISEERVKRAVEDRRAEIEHQIAETELRLKVLNDRKEGAEEEYRERLAAWESEFNAEHQKRLEAIAEREAALDLQEREMTDRLDAIGKTFREEATRLGDQLVAQLPLLERIGVLGVRSAMGGSPHHPQNHPQISGASTRPGTQLELPSFLAASKDGPEMNELEFLRQFERVVESEGFVFEHEDLVNFHVLVKTGAWTILTGPSGRGKSSLPRLYAKALGNLPEYLLVPVRPDWLDDRDVVGAFNALTGRYEPAASGLVDRLITAHEDGQRKRGGIYIICLDEMNLARVEHYFAIFLSLFEQPQDERHLKLFARGLGHPDDPYMPYRRLFLGSNIRFVGTVNVDETTHFFSPKVIDRTPIAAFDRPDLRLGLEPLASAEASTFRIDPVRHADLESWVRPASRSQETLDLLLRLDEALRRARLGLGFRLRDRILRYVGSAAEHLGEDRAVDLALLQNIVPRLRPTAPGYDELLKELQSLLPSGRFHRTAQTLKALSEDPESDFFQLL